MIDFQCAGRPLVWVEIDALVFISDVIISR